LPKSARRREKEREAEHERMIAALERHEKQLRHEHKRLARLADEKEAEQHRSRREREQKDRQRKQGALESRRLAALEHEWSSFKTRAAQAQHEQRREAYYADLQQTVDNLGRMAQPPAPAAEPEIVYVEKEENPAWGRLPTLPSWR
jgi:hypothetical protein